MLWIEEERRRRRIYRRRRSIIHAVADHGNSNFLVYPLAGSPVLYIVSSSKGEELAEPRFISPRPDDSIPSHVPWNLPRRYPVNPE